MTEHLRPEQFTSLSAPLTISVKTGDKMLGIELTVLAVKERPSHRHRDRPFSLSLSGPASPLLPQGTYPVRHPELGMISLFLVPAAQNPQSTEYEVTFN